MESLTLETIKNFMQCAPANIFFKDTECRYYFTSDVCDLVMAGEDGTLVGKTDLEIQKDPELGKFYYEDDKKILATGEGSQYVNAIPTAEGELSYFEIKKNAVRDKQGNIIGIVGIVSDVTDRVVAEKKIESLSFIDNLTRVYNRNYFNYGMEKKDKEIKYPFTIIMSDCDNLKMVNDVYGHEYGDIMLRTIGMTLKEEVSEECTVIRMGGDEFMIMCNGMSEEEADQLKKRIKKRLKDKSRDKIPLSLSMGSYTIEDGDFSMTHVYKEADRRMYADKKKRRDDVAEDNSVKSGFLSNMSHVLRTPMNGIIGMIELADQYPGNLDIQQKCRDKIRDLSGKLSSVVTDILEISRLESGDSADRKVSFDLSEVLMLSNTHAQRQAEEKNIQYIIDWDRSDWENADNCHAYVVGNAFYVEHILTSVADNAVKFTNPGGNIHVWCKEIEADSEKVVYEFSCQDNGIGMSPEFVSHAFDLFTQENDSKNGKYEGSGLGLAITKRMVERLGGRIDISSEKNKGTTVTMTIPFEIGSADESQKEENIENVSLQGLRALVVEDNELNMEIVEYILESNGMKVDKAVDGLEAVDKFKHSKMGYYNVILMDIMMPNMDGWEAARKIRAMRRYDAPVIPIIAMSANSFAEDIVKSRISGMNQHLPKPIDANKLLAEIKKYIKLEQD